MDEQKHAEEQQVEDLEIEEKEAQDVKGGGFSIGSERAKPTESLIPVEQLRGGWDGNHNETLVRI